MKIKIIFSGCDEIKVSSTFKKVNGFINKLFGENNERHGKYSNYSVSRLLGGTYFGDNVIFTDGAFITVSSNDDSLIGLLVAKIMKLKDDLYISKLKFKTFDLLELNVHSDYDIIRSVSPIRLQTKDKFITFNDDEFIPFLTDKSIRKLIHNGIDEDVAKTLKFELFHKENAKTRFFKFGECKNICSQVMLIVKGDKKARKAIYELGLGSSTGFGFGSVKVIDINN